MSSGRVNTLNPTREARPAKRGITQEQAGERPTLSAEATGHFEAIFLDALRDPDYRGLFEACMGLTGASRESAKQRLTSFPSAIPGSTGVHSGVTVRVAPPTPGRPVPARGALVAAREP